MIVSDVKRVICKCLYSRISYGSAINLSRIKYISKTQTCFLTVWVIETIKYALFFKRWCYWMKNLDKRKKKKRKKKKNPTFCSSSVSSSNEGRPLISNGGKCFLSRRRIFECYNTEMIALERNVLFFLDNNLTIFVCCTDFTRFPYKNVFKKVHLWQK